MGLSQLALKYTFFGETQHPLFSRQSFIGFGVIAGKSLVQMGLQIGHIGL